MNYKHIIKAGIFATILAVAATGSHADAAFARALTIGSSGSDVVELQTKLESQRFLVMPAGTAKGYFGTLTKNSVMKWQAAVGLPATGYFGPLSIAKIESQNSNNNSGSNSGNNGSSNSGSNSGELKGNEANLTDFELRREESTGDEGEEEVQVFTAEFDVEDGDIRVERMEILASSTDKDLSTKPWDYFDAVTISVNGKSAVSKDVDSKNDWTKVKDGVYRLTLTNLKSIVRENDRAEITVAFDIAGSIDSDDLDQEFIFSIGERGIRAIDAEGIQQYVGNDSEKVTFGFGAEENGDLSIKTVKEDPKASILVADEDNESDEYTVFAFEIDNKDDVDALVTDLTINVDAGASDADDVIRKAILVINGEEYDGDVNADSIDFDDIDVDLDGDDSVEAELVITLVRNATHTTLQFSVNANSIEAEGAKSGDAANVSGSAQSSVHTIAATGIDVDAVSVSRTVQTPGQNASDSYATYVIKFKVNAIEDNAYIATTTDADAAGNEGVSFTIAGNDFAGDVTSILTSTATKSNGFYLVREGKAETFTLTVTLNPSVAGTFRVGLNTITFGKLASFTDVSTFAVDHNDGDFQTDPAYIPN